MTIYRVSQPGCEPIMDVGSVEASQGVVRAWR